MLDPNPLVSGKGIKILQDAGVAVDVGLLEDEAKDLNRGFIKRMQTGMPFVTSKIAMSIDGKIAMKSGESKWITSEASRNNVQILRSENQAIMTGSKTVLNDNPKMTVRLNNSKSKPLRVVIDSNNQIIDKSLNIFSSDAGTLILNNSNSEILSNGKLDLKSALRQLGKKGINTLLLEAGSGLNGAMLEAGLIDEYIIYTAPVILGSNASSMINIPLNKMSEKIELIILDIRQIGSDIKIRATLK
jgi:diaminohydroxyphosphoribosylaminopyrimidine deaminase/5-amino-6-(5-phosphoribosylamino)uracil reductase